MSTKGFDPKAAIRGAEARTREIHARSGALKPMDSPIQDTPQALRAKAELKAAAERLLSKR